MKLVGSRRAVRTPEFHKKKLIQGRLKIFGALLLLALIIAGPILVLRNKNFVIDQIEVSGNEVTKSEDIQKIVTENMEGYYWKLIPKSSAVFYPKNEIEREILALTPRLRAADISLKNTRSIKVEVIERQPHALYCSTNCFFLDETGFIFAEAPKFEGNVYFTYGTDPVLENPIGTQLFSQEELTRLEEFIHIVSFIGVEPEMLRKIESDTYALFFKKGPVVKWKIKQDLDVVSVNLQSFADSKNFSTAEILRMEYIDLSFDNKVFYRFQGE